MEGEMGAVGLGLLSSNRIFLDSAGTQSLSSVTYSLDDLGKGDPVQASLSNWEDYLR